MPVDVIWVPEMGEGRMPGGGVGLESEGVAGELDWDKITFLLRKAMFVDEVKIVFEEKV